MGGRCLSSKTGKAFLCACSPSPRPSPPGRGRNGCSVLRNQGAGLVGVLAANVVYMVAPWLRANCFGGSGNGGWQVRRARRSWRTATIAAHRDIISVNALSSMRLLTSSPTGERSGRCWRGSGGGCKSTIGNVGWAGGALAAGLAAPALRLAGCRLLRFIVAERKAGNEKGFKRRLPDEPLRKG